MQLENKNVVITGGCKGIGKALVEIFIEEGAKVVIADLPKQNPYEFAKHYGTLGVNCDVSVEKQVKNLVKKAEQWFGSVDLFVSNAGVTFGEASHAASATNNVWDQCWRIHVMAHVFAARAVLPSMIKRKNGYFLQVISAAALLTQIGDAAYSATKRASLSFAESLAITHKRDGISVSAVCPQYVATEMIGIPETQQSASTNNIMSPNYLAKIILKGLKDETFLILPNPEVYKFMNFKARFYEKWIDQMNKLRSKAASASNTIDIKTFHKYL